jgi:hypothetical protein
LDEFQRFVDEQYPMCSWRHLAVQKLLLKAVRAGVEVSIEKKEKIIDRSLSIIDQLSIHPDPSSSANIELLKAATLSLISDIRSIQEDLTEDVALKCLGYLEEGRKIRESFGDALGVARSEDTIARYKARCMKRFGSHGAFGELFSLEQMIEMHRNIYYLTLEEHGEVASLRDGSVYAISLIAGKRTIEAWRLLKRLIATSQQYHGREHRSTIEIEGILRPWGCNLQGVKLRSLGLSFNAIGYEDNKYVLQGPIGVPEERMQTLRVDPTDVILGSHGNPVICHGLKNKAAYLNGKIGDIRSFDETTGRYGVYFEDESIKPKSMKPRNLRILFELPDN